MNRRPFPKRSATGLTVIELLVTLAIVAILAVLLLPVVGRVKKRSLQTSDISNFRQLGIAFEQFTQEHRNFLLIGLDRSNFFGKNATPIKYQSWMSLIQPYMPPGPPKSVQIAGLVSPADPSKGGAEKIGPDKTHRSYGINSRNEWAEKPLNKLEIGKPSQFVTMGNYDISKAGDSAGINGGLSGGSNSMDKIPRDWYGNDSADFLFLDGHVESIQVDDILPGAKRYSLFNRDLNRPENRAQPESGF